MMEYELDLNGYDLDQPLVYYWIVGSDDYVGKAGAGRGKRRIKRYARNVQRMTEGKPPLNGRAYRAVHIRLAEAVRRGESITVRILENCDPGELIGRERALIEQLKPTLNRT
ncbi:hypothetical protein [Ruegeria sp. HKCCSP351]|uniref:hypothetical protein n=1 Tax=Ruegeria sp. HKCCSP351 TaxID=2794832 RepID=UPI001AEA4E66|nr:hypothetical protein [Ruegeria sp. HKCCSP351]